MDQKIEELRVACVAYQGADESHKREIFRIIAETVRSIDWPGGSVELPDDLVPPVDDEEEGIGVNETSGGK